MEISLKLDSLKFANVSDFTRTYGTKVQTNGGSLTTKEFNEDMAKIYDLQRPIEVTEDSTTGTVEYNANIVMNSATAITLTLGNGTYIGCKLKLMNISTVAHSVTLNSITIPINANDVYNLIWNGTSWDNEDLLIVSDIDADAQLTIPTSNHFEVMFKNGHYGDSFTINNKPVYVSKDGELVQMTSHSIDRGDGEKNWYVQPNTVIEFIRMSDKYLVKGNPIVLSKSSDTEGYTVYADGYIKQYYHLSGFGEGKTKNFTLPFTKITNFSQTQTYVDFAGYKQSVYYNWILCDYNLTSVKYTNANDYIITHITVNGY